MEMTKTATRIKYYYKCLHCGAQFIFYVKEDDADVDEKLDKKLWCVACRKQGGLVRGEKVKDGFI